MLHRLRVHPDVITNLPTLLLGVRFELGVFNWWFLIPWLTVVLLAQVCNGFGGLLHVPFRCHVLQTLCTRHPLENSFVTDLPVAPVDAQFPLGTFSAVAVAVARDVEHFHTAVLLSATSIPQVFYVQSGTPVSGYTSPVSPLL